MTGRRLIRVFKIGGNVVDNPDALDRFISDFAKIDGYKVLVHGGGKEATRMAERLGIKSRMIEGRRVTDRETLDIVTMIYAGLVNKRVVSKMQSAGINAIGLTGADGNVVEAKRRAPEPIDYGFVGDIDPENVNVGFLEHNLLSNGLVPVICAIMHDGNGSLLNCNADGVAAAIALGLAQNKNNEIELIYCFEKDGVMTDVNDDNSLIGTITKNSYEDLKNRGVVTSGMIPKIDSAFKSIDGGVETVIIKNSLNIGNEKGTKIKLS